MGTKPDSLTVQADLVRLNQLAETQRWVHHVADLDTRNLLTFPLDAPITPLSRAERLSRVRQRIDLSIFGGLFGGMSYRLTPTNPFQSTGPASLVATSCSYYHAANDIIVWWLPEVLPEHEVHPPGMTFYFSVPQGVGLALLSISLNAWAWPDRVGHVRVEGNWGPTSQPVGIRVPITGSFAVHTLDLAINIPNPNAPGRIISPRMLFESGVQWVAFRSVSFREAPPVLSPD